MASGVGGWPADCIPAPGRQASAWRESGVVERLETLGFPEVYGSSTRDCWDGHDSLKEGLPGRGRGAGEWVSGRFEACPWRKMAEYEWLWA